MNSELGKCGKCREKAAVESVRGLPVCKACANELMGTPEAKVEAQLDEFAKCHDNREDFEQHGKEAINMLLWRFLPANITLGRADEIACKIFDLINHPEGP